MLKTWCGVQLKALALKTGCTPDQLTLARLLAQGEDVVEIPLPGFVFSFTTHCRG